MNCAGSVAPFIIANIALLLTVVYLGIGWPRAERRASRAERDITVLGWEAAWPGQGARPTNSGHKSRGRDSGAVF